MTVSTIHKAKGLEWDAVLVPRLTMGSLPSVFAKSSAELAEERRLLYVAITRARATLELSSATERGSGGWRLKPSMFLASLEPGSPGAVRGGHGMSAARSRPSASRGHVAVSVASVLTVGARVTHDAHGMGTVVAVAPTAVKVRFSGSQRPTPVKVPTAKMQTL